MRQSSKLWIALMTAIGLTTPVLSTEQRGLDSFESLQRNKRIKIAPAPSTDANDLEAQPLLPTGGWIIVDLFSWLDGKDFVRAAHVCTGWRAAAHQIGDTKRLDLSYRKFNETDYQNLLTIPIGHLILNYYRSNDAAARILSQKLGLKTLHLGSNKISTAGAQSLVPLTNLTTLNIVRNAIGSIARANLKQQLNRTHIVF